MVSFLKRELYQSSEKPPQDERDFDLLNDKTISVRIGAYNNIKMSDRYIFCIVDLIKMLFPPHLYHILKSRPYLQQ